MNPSAAYAQQAAATASPAQLVLMLFDGALARTEAGRSALGADRADLQAAHTALTKAQAIVEQLRVSLDHEAGGTLADNLAELYGFCLDGLLRANVLKDPAPLGDVLGVLAELRDAWQDACIQGPVTVAVAG